MELAAEGNDVTIEDLANFADVFYCGGTKCGAMLVRQSSLPTSLLCQALEAI